MIDIDEFGRTYTGFMKAVTAASEKSGELTSLGQHIQDFLGVAITEIEPVIESFPGHQVVDIDLALEAVLAEHNGVRRGISGSHRNHVDNFSDFLTRAFGEFALGGVAYERKPAGPEIDRRVIAVGLGEVRIDGVPVVWLQRTAQPRFGRERYTLEILCPDAEVTDRLIADVRERMSTLSVLRGQVISFVRNEFDYHSAGSDLTFLRRPSVTAEQVILPDGVLDRVVRHVVGIGESRETLRAAGQHLKRGVLLYGPPGTGKTHLIRHLLSRTTSTAVLLSGRSLGLLNDATQLARATQPAMVILEDCDLVAEHRGGDTNALLFEMLEAMDGLGGDADVTFVLTTNRVDLLERALVERPGRVDLAVEIAKPDESARAELFRLYAADLLDEGGLTEASVTATAERTEGVTASFTKELVRRVVLDAAQDGRTPTDADVDHALDEMLSDAETLTRTLLGGGDQPLEPRPVAMPGLYPGPAYGSTLSVSYDED